MTSRFEKVAVAVVKGNAVDKQTAIAMSGGAEYTPPQESSQPTYYTPPPLRDIPPDPSLIDFTGKQFGRLTVLGLAESGFDGVQARWACRCTCGKYSTHRGRALKLGAEDRCHQCEIGRKVTDGVGGKCKRCGGMAKFMPYCGKCGKELGRPAPVVGSGKLKAAKEKEMK
jgi:hypothetical protein